MSAAAGPRFNVLDPYLARLRSGGVVPTGEPLLRTLEGDEITVDEWAQSKLELHLHGAAPGEDAGRLVAESVALLTKYGDDLSRFGIDQLGEELTGNDVQAELMLNAAVGMALVKQIQGVIDGLLKDGRINDARPLSQFQNKLRNVACDARKRIDAGERQRVAAITTDLAGGDDHGLRKTSTNESTDASGSGTTNAATRGAARRRRVARPGIRVIEPVRAPTLTEVLAGLLFIAVVVWLAGVVVPDQLAQPESLPTGLNAVEPLRRIDFRHPAVFARVDEPAWSALAPDERDDLLADISTLISPHGYTGLFLTSESGEPLAHWIHTHGTAVLDSVERPTPGWPPEKVANPAIPQDLGFPDPQLLEQR